LNRPDAPRRFLSLGSSARSQEENTVGEAYAFKSGCNRIRRANRYVFMLGVSDWIALAAAPTFAILAGLTLVLEAGSPDVLCSATQHASPLNSMVLMYVLMSVFHSAPWLRLLSGRGNGTHPT
jgi:hypothetical protein